MENVRYKIVKPDLKTVDKDAGTVHAVLSTENRDRDGDIIRQKHWDMGAFLAHPVIIDSHDYSGLNNVIGEWSDVRLINAVDEHGKHIKDAETGEDVFDLVGTANYFLGKNPQSDYAFFLVKQGLGAYSVGFIPDFEKAEEIEQGKSFMGFEFRGQELLEASQVTIPSNRESLQAMMGGRQRQRLLGDSDIPQVEKTGIAAVDALAELVRGHMVTTSETLKDIFGLLEDLENPPDYETRFKEAFARAQEAQ